jgi:hypothetical protein
MWPLDMINNATQPKLQNYNTKGKSTMQWEDLFTKAICASTFEKKYYVMQSFLKTRLESLWDQFVPHRSICPIGWNLPIIKAQININSWRVGVSHGLLILHLKEH